jgi:pyruvate dehydrogenase E2 component (dihydrolipoamide acetyltransferase)
MAGTAWDAPKDPTIYGFLDIDAGPIERRIAQLRFKGVHVTVTYVVAHAVAKAVGNHPDLNVMLRWGRPWRREKVDVFLQVALPGEDGLGSTELSGVKISEADKADLDTFAGIAEEKVKEVRTGKDELLDSSRRKFSLLPQFMRRAALRLIAFLTYTCNLSPKLFGLPKDPFGSAAVTSVGMMGIDTGFAPLFPVGGPPIIVTVGAIQARPVVNDDGRVVAKSMLRLGGTFDHRVLDGYHIAAFSQDLMKELEQEPERIEGYQYNVNSPFPY